MSKSNPPCRTVQRWLTENLGKGVTAPLTGTDTRALAAVVHIAELYGYERNPEICKALGQVVRFGMQPKCWYLAYHAIAMVLDWSDRAFVWNLAGLPPLIGAGRCLHEPAFGRLEPALGPQEK